MTRETIDTMSEAEVRSSYAALQREYDAVNGSLSVKNRMLDDYSRKIDTLRPLAAVGARAMRGEWWKHNPQRDVYICLVCFHCNGHTNDCPVLAAQESEDHV